MSGAEFPTNEELYDGEVGQVITMTSHEYRFSEGFNGRDKFRVSKGALLISLGRRRNRDFIFVVDKQQNTLGGGWLHSSRIASRKAMRPLDSLYPGLKKFVATVREQNRKTTLAEAPVANTGKLHVKASPAHARVRIMNIRPQYTPLMELPLGKSYDIEVDAPGYATARRTVTLKDKITPVIIDLKPINVASRTTAVQTNMSAAEVAITQQGSPRASQRDQRNVRAEQSTFQPEEKLKQSNSGWLDVVRRTEFGMGVAKKFVTTPMLFIPYLIIAGVALFTPSFWDLSYRVGIKIVTGVIFGVVVTVILYVLLLLAMSAFDASLNSGNVLIAIIGGIVFLVFMWSVGAPFFAIVLGVIAINYIWPVLVLLALPGLLIFAYDIFYYFVVSGGALTQRHGAEAGLHASRYQKAFNEEIADGIFASVQRPFKAVNTWADGIHYEVQSRRARKMSKMLDEEAEMLKKYENIEKLRERKRKFDHVE